MRTTLATIVVCVVGLALWGRASRSATASSAPVLKTPWGEPDLQGIWTDETETPLQRPAKYANQEFLHRCTAEQNWTRERAALARSGQAPGARDREEDVAGAYNATFNDPKKTGLRTSLIVDPPDGRLPAETPEVSRRSAAADRAFRPRAATIDRSVQEQKNAGV